MTPDTEAPERSRQEAVEEVVENELPRLTLTNDLAHELVIGVASGTLDDVPRIAAVLGASTDLIGRDGLEPETGQSLANGVPAAESAANIVGPPRGGAVW